MKRAVVLVLVLVTAGLACGPAPNLLPVNDLNRPTDVAFMCFGAFPAGTGIDGGVPDGGAGPLTVSGRPMRACHPQGQYDPGATTTTRTFAFLPNSAAGTLSAVDADHWKLVDLDPDTGGYGTAPLGQLPEQISVSDDGCRLISANRGSCDLTLVDPSVLVAPTFSTENGGNVVPPSPRTASLTIRPIKGDGTLLTSSPYEAVFLPQDTTSLVVEPTSSTLPILPAPGPLCGDNAAVNPVGWPAAPRSWYALVTYPSCDLITMVALPSGNIVSSAYVRPTADGQNITLVDAGTSPVCPISDCAGQALPPGTAAVSSGAAVGDGGPTHAAPPTDAASDTGLPDAGTGSGEAGAGAGGTGGGTDGGVTGGTPGGALLGNQYPDVPYLGPGPLSPSGIAIVPDGSRAYVSLANASFVVSVGLSSGGLALPGNGIYLHEGARGSSRVRLNVDPTRSTGSKSGVAGVFVGADPSFVNESMEGPPNFAGLDSNREYLYAIARDGTLRVMSVVTPGAETECEANADPLHLPPGLSASTACIPVNPAYRRPFSVGPGIRFPSLPIDVAAADIQNPTSPYFLSEQSVNGAHAWVITDSGIVYLVNLNPILRNYEAVVPPGYVTPTVPNVTEPPPFVNTLRDRNEISYSLTLDPTSGPPRVDVLPAVPATGPYIEQFYTQGSVLNATALTGNYVETIAFFPQEPPTPANTNDPIDRRAITPQTWTVSWEGALSGVRNTGNPLPVGDPTTVDSLFNDGGVNYCALGVVPGDLVTLTGCTDDTQCGLGEACVAGDAVSAAAAGLSVTGICVDPNRESAQEASCAQFLNSLRRYEVLAASPNSLMVRPRLDEIVIPAIITPACTPDVPATATAPAMTDSCPDTTEDPTTAKFRCVSSDPVTGAAPRCLMPCTGSDSECRAGRVCVDFQPAQPESGKPPPPRCSSNECFCADAPPFDDTGKSCFDQLVAYQVNAGRSFVVAGSQAGFDITATLPPSGICAANPTPDSRFSFRIPMDAPTCTNVPSNVATIDSRINPDFVSGAANVTAVDNAQTLVDLVRSTPAPTDPCFYLGGPITGDPPTDPSMPPTTPPPTHVRALFQNSQLSFVLANLDRAPTFEFFTSFDVHGGFSPQLVQDPTTVEVSMPARIILGPIDSLAQITSGTPPAPAYEAPYLFVVDQRRLGLEQGGGPTRGQLLRINPYGYTSSVGTATGYQPIFEDYNTSGGLFPIQ
jgi:hypothetical protein